MLASALQSGRTNGRRPEGKSNSDRRSTRKNFMKTAGGGAIPRLARVMTCLMLMLTGLGTGAWAADTYTVAGSNSAMFGSAWDASNTANDMTKNGDGTYSITYTNVYLDDDVQYKVVKNHSWDEAYPAGNNRVITIAEAGTYTVTICFNPTTHEVYEKKPGYTVSLAEGTEDAENWTVTVGDGGTAQALPVEGLSEGQTLTLTYYGNRRVKSVTAVQTAASVKEPAATPNIAQADCTFSPSNGTSTLSNANITTSMEYSADNGTTWTDVTSNGSIASLAAGTVQIRVKETVDNLASEAVSITVPEVLHINELVGPYTGDRLTCEYYAGETWQALVDRYDLIKVYSGRAAFGSDGFIYDESGSAVSVTALVDNTKTYEVQ